MNLATIGKRIQSLRKGRAWSCRELARKAKVSANTILNAEAGDSISTSTLYKIADALGVDVVALTIESKKN